MNSSSSACPDADFVWSFVDTRSLVGAFPFYYSPKPALLPGISDQNLSLAAPVIAYWASSTLFHILDTSDWKWLDKYRIHDSAEVKSRNLVSKWQVIKAVILQQIVQTILGLWWMGETRLLSESEHLAAMNELGGWVASVVLKVLGAKAGGTLLRERGADLVYFLYWWGIPIAQFLFSMFIIDTWQYFLHRLMHINKTLYRHFHSVHHRLYVPYAFGALYNHPVEGFVLDSLGAALAEAISGLTVRQAVLLFCLSTFKTVDDHCGYRLPFDPFQLMSGNNADYHDIHHQVIGIKSNFSQPFFTHWDAILGTRMTRADIERRRRKVHDKKA